MTNRDFVAGANIQQPPQQFDQTGRRADVLPPTAGAYVPTGPSADGSAWAAFGSDLQMTGVSAHDNTTAQARGSPGKN